MKLQIRTDRVYGRTVYYPVNAEAKALAEIAGSKTLTTAVLSKAQKAFGATVEMIQPKPEGL